MAEATINGESIYLVTKGADASGGIVVPGNSSTATLGAGSWFTGVATDAQKYAQITVAVFADQPGTLYVDQGTDTQNWDHTVSYAVAASTAQTHQILVVAEYFRVRFQNTAGVQNTAFRLQSILHETAGNMTVPASSTFASVKDAQLTRAIITGQNLAGTFQPVGVTVENFLKSYMAGPASAYGDIMVADNTPVLQADFALGALFADQWVQQKIGTGDITFDGAMISVSTGATANSYAYLSTRRVLRERGGQGRLARFSALFTSGVANSMQIAGLFSAANGFAVGYFGATFGAHFLRNGVYEVRTLTVTTASSTAENATVKLNGVDYAVAVTNSSNKITTANELAAGTYGGLWTAYSVAPTPADPYVVFVAVSPGARSGAYSLTATSATGTFATTCAGASPTYDFVPQSSWNQDPMDGTGPSGMTLVPTKGNVYAIDHQYLGFGAVNFYLEEPVTGRLILVHRLRYANANTTPNVAVGSMPIGILSQSFGSTTNLAVKCASIGGFLQGPIRYPGSRRGVTKETSGLAASYQPLLSIRNPSVFASKVQFSEVHLEYLSAACDGNKAVDFILVLNPTLTAPAWANLDTSKSILQVDTAATAYTGGIELFAMSLPKAAGETVNISSLDLYLRAGEWATLAARSAAASNTNVTICVIEDT